MRNFIKTTLGIAAMATMLVSCSSNGNKSEEKEPSRLETEIAAVQEMLPIHKSDFGTITKVTYEDNYVNIYIEIDGSQVSFDAIADNADMSKSMMLNAIKLAQNKESSLNDSMTQMMRWIGEDKAGQRFIYKDTTTGREYTIEMTPEEIQNALNSEEDSSDVNSQILDQILDNVRLELGQTSEDGITLTDVIKNDERVIVEYTMDEELYDLDLFEENVAGEKMSLIREYKQEQVMAAMLRVIKNEGLGFTIRYVGDKSGKKCNLSYSNEEL